MLPIFHRSAMIPNMGLGGAVLEVRERVLDVVRDAAALACACEPDRPCLACRARAVLDFLTTAGFRLNRWRNPPGPPVAVRHVAGPVIACREHRPSCPGYIVDRRQACACCGAELRRGKWAVFFDVGAPVGVLTPRSGVGVLAYGSAGGPAEVPCLGQAAAVPLDEKLTVA